MCVSECVPACVCFGGLQGRGRGSGKGTELSLLCCFVSSCVARRKSTTKRGEPKWFVCPALLPSPLLVHSLTYRALLNGQEWPWGWREPHRQTDHSVEMFVQQRSRKRGRKKDGVRTTWVSPSPCLPSLPFPPLWQRVTIQPKPLTKMFTVRSGEKKSVSQRLPRFDYSVCVWGAAGLRCRPHIIKHGEKA